MKLISVVGLGPGNKEWIAQPVLERLAKADVILGYYTYINQIEGIAPHVEREASGMRAEVMRAKRAVELANQHKKVVVVSGGDAGIYGMAGLIFEVLEDEKIHDVEVDVLPGISALNAAASLLGAPIMNDFAVISLSDYLTPLEDILLRVSQAAKAGFVLCLFNPSSHKRKVPFEKSSAILQKILPDDTPVGIVRNAYRESQEVLRLTLKELITEEVGMDSIIIVGNKKTRWINQKMVTPRGYTIRQGENKNST